MAHTQNSHLAGRVLLPHCIKNTAVLNEINLAAGLWMVELFLHIAVKGVDAIIELHTGSPLP